MNPKVDWYFTKADKWQEELEKLRIIALDCQLNEELKWGCPAYTNGKSNIVLIHWFKDYCALLFFKGVLLSNTKGLLIQQTENVQAARQMRFTSVQQIIEQEPDIKAVIFEAIEVDKSGVKVSMKKTKEFPVTEELEQKFVELPALKTAFEALTPGRQRAYLLHFSQPKQVKTREARIEKAMEAIFNGKGLND